MLMAMEHPVPYQPTTVTWHGDGTYTPACGLCGYEGRPCKTHGAAVAACRQHCLALSHRAKMHSRA